MIRFMLPKAGKGEENFVVILVNGRSVKIMKGVEYVVREKGEWDIKHRHHGGFRRYTGLDDFGEEHTITVDERSECDEPYCPKCGKWNESVWRNFCPNCGADMRGDQS